MKLVTINKALLLKYSGDSEVLQKFRLFRINNREIITLFI